MRRRTRVHTHRKRTPIRLKRSRTPKHLRFHMIYIYSTMGIFGLVLTLAVVQKTFEPFVFGTQSSSRYVLGESVSKEPAPQTQTEKPFYIKIIDIFLP